jgi:hypothetical protein
MENNRINSSSAHVTLKSQDWLRKTEADNVTWIPLFAEYYYSYMAIIKQWMYVDETKKFKLEDVPEIEIMYQNLTKP